MKKAPKKLRKAYSFPKWAAYIAQDLSGDWWAYEGMPAYVKSCGTWEVDRSVVFSFLGTGKPPKKSKTPKKAKKQLFKL